MHPQQWLLSGWCSFFEVGCFARRACGKGIVMSTRQELISSVLETFTNNTGNDVAGVAAVGMDGIVLVSKMSSDTNADKVGAMAATMMGVTRVSRVNCRSESLKKRSSNPMGACLWCCQRVSKACWQSTCGKVRIWAWCGLKHVRLPVKLGD